jgi:outer membrane protein assembly factor BamB
MKEEKVCWRKTSPLGAGGVNPSPLALLSFLFIVLFFISCNNKNGNIISEIKIGTHNNNELKIQIDITTTDDAEVFAEYWPDSIREKGKRASLISKKAKSHSIVICDIIPETNYSYQLTTIQNEVKTVSKIYAFQSRKLPAWLQEQFRYNCPGPELLPAEFKSGLMLLNKRESPGIAYIVDYKGRIKWYQMVDGTGYKVVNFTKDTSVIGILGKNDEPTSYGSEILEVNMFGDTVLYLKKGQGDLKYSIHHEILKRNKNEVVTLYVDQRIMDLSSVGGTTRDTINGDGILILDHNGKKLWQWSVFDVTDPLKDLQIIMTKKDWMHANSLNYDKDSNYIISFYNTGQIWKLDSHTGKIMWKYGKGGTIAMPAEAAFSQSHAVHINPFGSMMFFDNGVEKKQSEVFAVKLDETTQSAKINMHFKLPVEVYNDRMGSAYMVGDSTVLCCCSKKHMTVLVNKKGELLWTLQSGMPPYRVQFLEGERLLPYLQPPVENK